MKDIPDRSDPARRDPLIGKTVSHYKVLDRLGQGGMGVVYTASDLRLGRKVALKFLPPRDASTELQRRRFIQEATTASSLDHPNICTIFEIGESKDGRMFMAMAYYEGQTLRKKIASGPLAIHVVLDLAAQLASGLGKAHEHGIVHRDIKPSNLIITHDHILKILDFGVARVSGSNLTNSGEAVGTLAYMSPEQVSGEPVDHRTDIWSAAAVIYEMVTGQLPFTADSARQVLSAIITQQPRDLSSIRRGIPPELTRIIRKGLSKNPEDRHSDARELLADVGRQCVRPRPAPTGWMRRRPHPFRPQ